MKRSLILSLVAVGIFWPGFSRAATLFFSPSSQSVTVGQSIAVTVKVGAGGQAINSAEATVTYPTNLLTLTAVSKSSSIFSFWALNPGSANDGSVSFIGGLPSPGYSGSSGTIVRLSFTAKAAGTATIRYSGGKVLANDGQGTDVLQGVSSSTVSIAAKPSGGSTTPPPAPPPTPGRPAPTISSSDFPNQNAWSSKTTATVTWNRPSGLQGFSYTVDKNAATVPDENIDAVSLPLTLTLTDGITYVHVRAKYESGWSNTATYALRRDGTPPEPFSVTIQQDRGSSDPTPTAVFSATDAASGIASYQVQINGGPATPATSPHQLSIVAGGTHTVVVTAIDQAGNKRESTATVTVTGYPAPVITSLTSPILLLESFTVAGTAALGDVVVILLDGQEVGQATAATDAATPTDGTAVQVPWSFRSTMIIGPGKHAVTVKSLGPEGQESVASDPAQLFVVGNSIFWRGRPIATLALAPPLAIVALLIILLNAYIFGRLLRHAHQLWRHDRLAEHDLELLRQRVRHERLTAGELDAKLRSIEDEISSTRSTGRSRRPARRNRS